MLQQKAMIANLIVRAWTGQRGDKNVSKEVEKNHGAKDAGKYTKHLVAKEALKPLNENTSKVRDMHYAMTLPWGDNGDRILPSKMYMKYTDQMRGLKAEREQLAKNFKRDYPQLIIDSKIRLGTMFSSDDYPSAADIDRRFNIELAFLPVPDANDFRVDVGQEAVDEIKQNITASVKARQVAAVQSCWKRMEDVLTKMVDRLSDPEAVFRDSLFENAVTVAELVPDLNIDDDVHLNTAAANLLKVASRSPERVRNEKGLREDVCDEARTLLIRVRGHIRQSDPNATPST